MSFGFTEACRIRFQVAPLEPDEAT